MDQQQAEGLIFSTLSEMASVSRLRESDRFPQHGDTTVLLHSLAVAYYTLRVLEWLPIRYDRNSMLRGALLHDYFLYDWHDPDPSHRLHGYHHPRKAYENATTEFDLNSIEADIILHHMFPLTLTPPHHRESLIVSLVDKGCSCYETLCRNTYPALRNRLTQIEKRGTQQ